MKARPRVSERWSTVAPVALLVLATAAALCLLRRTEGFSENVELPLYDALTIATWPWKVGHPDVMLVTIQKPGPEDWPLSDAQLAEALRAILNGEPSVVGIDMAAHPEGGTWDSEELQHLFGRNDNLIAIYCLPGYDGVAFPAPPFTRVLAAADARWNVATANLPADGETRMMLRRGFLSITPANEPKSHENERISLAALCAFHHVRHGSTARSQEFLDWLHAAGNLEADSAGYALNDMGGSQHLLKPGPDLERVLGERSANISLVEVLRMSPAERQRVLKDKLVLLGTHDSSGGGDVHPLPGNRQVRGIRVHALAAGQLLREFLDKEPPVKWLPNGIEDLCLLLACAMAGTAVGCCGPRSWRALLAITASVLAVIAGGGLALRAGWWIPAGAPALGALATGIGTLAIRHAASRRINDEAYLLFARKFGNALADRLWEHRRLILSGGKIPEEEFEGTVLFSDLAGYSAATRALQASGEAGAFGRWIGTYMNEMIGLVIEHGGMIKDLEGDGLMAVFGFPATGSDGHAAAAVQCGQAMARAVARLNAERGEGVPHYRARVGIYTGTISAIQQGSARQFDYALIGHAVNLARRLEQFRKTEFKESDVDVRVLAGNRTRELAGNVVRFDAVDPEPVRVDERLEPEIVWTIHLS